MSVAHLSADKPSGLVPQDNALADYLEGLLKDDSAPEPSHLPVKLAIVATQPQPTIRTEYQSVKPQIPNTVTEDMAPSELCTSAPANDLTLTIPQQGETIADKPNTSKADGTHILLPQTEPDQPQTAAANNPADFSESLVHPQVAQAPHRPLEDALPSPSVCPWRIFSAGAIKIAIARTAIKHVLSPTALTPIAGAPQSVAGALEHEGRIRMVLSLPAWLGAQKLTDTTLTFGAQGLWGLNVGQELLDFVWDDTQTSWREAGTRNPARPGFMGFNQAAGLVFLDPNELRALFDLTN